LISCCTVRVRNPDFVFKPTGLYFLLYNFNVFVRVQRLTALFG
jgi:hypothetical protein